MPAAEIVKLVLIASIMLIVLSLGLRTSMNDVLWLPRRPARLLRSVAAIYLVVPAAAVGLCLAFPLALPVKIALVALAVSPLPPLLPMKQEGAGAEHAYALSLLVCAALLSIVLTPLLTWLAARVFALEVTMAPLAVIRIMALTILLPLAAGMGLKVLFPTMQWPLGDYASKAGKFMIALAVVALLYASWRSILDQVGDGSVLAIAALVLAGLVAGHLLAGGSPADRSALAFAAASRHPGLAIAIAGANFTAQAQEATGAIGLFLLVNALVSIPYRKWVKRQGAGG